MQKINELPESLQCLKKGVKQLYYYGNLELLSMPKVAIVGSRRCTPYTKNIVLSLARELKNNGICVVSGAAIGVDIIAHEGAFPSTIAVFGNGLDQIYPIQNKDIIEKIYYQGLALSEYEPSFRATNWSFLERNRIVVGLCEAVVIAQADLKSGSMSSAHLALNMNIPLFVLPQRLDESPGTNELLKNSKASLITDFKEFAAKFARNTNLVNVAKTDEVLEFLSKNSDFNECYAKFGDRLYEYELEGKIAIDGVFVRVL